MTKLFSFFLLFTAASLAQNLVSISDLRMNTPWGSPVDSGKIVTIEGIVTAANNFGTNGPGAVQDLTAGISVYNTGFVSKVQIGDSVSVTGKVTQFRGLTQIDFSLGGASVIVHSSGYTVEPQIVTISQIINQEWNGYEEFESKLIRINNVTIPGTGNFTGGSSGQNYSISDLTGSMEIRIDESVNIVGTPIPSGTFDIIGILSQYKSGVPYNTGYQLMPRSILDIVDDGRPVILNPVVASNITTNSFSVFFHTAREGNTQIKYGFTPDLELDSIVVQESVTFHEITVPGLESAKTYYFKVLSSNEQGISVSDLHTTSTASNDPSIGKINVYFNFSIDPSVALPGNIAQGNVNFIQKLVERINSASTSIDMALYSFFGMPDIVDALILAKTRGVKIRVVYHNRTTQNSMQSLIDAGIPVLKRTSTNGLMHNKFIIFDSRDTVLANDWVWTGSWNVTSTEVNWKNNIVEINDPSLATAYLTEFEEMWGSNSDQPNSSLAKFGFNKQNNTSHTFNIGGREVRLYFSPSDGTTQQIYNQIMNADKSIYFAQYAFTMDNLGSAIKNRHTAGVTDVKGIIDQINTDGSEYTFLKTFAEMWQSTTPTQHHKYAVIDASYPDYQPVVITGSHNWSNSAETDNDENTLIIFDHLVANQYLQEFKKRYNEAGGTSTIYLPVELTSFNASSSGNNVRLSWTTSSELNNFGFEIERSYDGKMFLPAGFVRGTGTTTNSQSYIFVDQISEGKNIKIYYRLRQVDFDGTSVYSNVIEVQLTKVLNYKLLQNYPNPFNPSTVIEFEVPCQAPVLLKVYDLTGQEIATLVNEVKQPGNYTINFNASELSSGMYIYRLITGEFQSVKKMSIIK